MRILRLAQTLPPLPGGQEIHVRELTLTQAVLGDSVDLVFAQGESPCRPEITAHPISLHARGPARWWPAQHRFAWNASRHHGFRPGQVEIVHGHGDYTVAWAALRFADTLGCPSVLTIHAGLSDRSVHQLVSRLLFPRITRLIAVSVDIARQLQARGVPHDRITTISSGIHYRNFARVPVEERATVRAGLGVGPAGQLIAAVGRLHPLKGFRHLVAAAPRLLAQFPGLRIVIVGDGPESRSLRDLAGHCPAVSFLGALCSSKLSRLLQAADLFVLPSLDLGSQREGTPTSIMEAMASGLPVVATRSGGIPQLVENGVHGELVPPGDENALAEAIAKLLGDPVLRDAIGDRNRRAMVDRDWSEVARKIEAVYQDARSLVRSRAQPVSS